MREIKFKYYLDLQTHIHTFVFTLEEIEQRIFTHDEKIVIAKCQYTGLKDKNGVDIYEGDKIKMWDQMFIVKWDKSHSRFGLYKEGKLEKCNSGIGVQTSYKVEIIGNIYNK